MWVGFTFTFSCLSWPALSPFGSLDRYGYDWRGTPDRTRRQRPHISDELGKIASLEMPEPKVITLYSWERPPLLQKPSSCAARLQIATPDCAKPPWLKTSWSLRTCKDPKPDPTLWYTYSLSTWHSFAPLKLIKPQILLQNQILHLILSIVTPSHHPGFLNGLVFILILRFLATFYISKSTILHHRIY
jgi:hypothetical protein